MENKCKLHIHWRPETHFTYSLNTRNNVKDLLLVLKKYEKEYGIKIPKFVKFEIIKYMT